MLEIVNDGVANLSQKRQLYDLLRLLHRERYQVVVPVNFAELEIRDIRSTKAKPRCEERHCIVPFANSTAAGDGALDSQHLFLCEEGRHPFRMPDAERLEELAEVTLKEMLFLPEPEQHSQGGNDVHFVGGMGKDKGDNVLFGNILLMTDALRPKMMQELTQVKAVVTDGGFAAAQVDQMLYQLLHVPPQFTIQTMINRREATFADVSGQKHVVKHLDASDLLPLLWADSSIVVASFNEHSSYALFVLCEAIGLHEKNNTVSPKPFVHIDAVSRIAVLLEENEASFH